MGGMSLFRVALGSVLVAGVGVLAPLVLYIKAQALPKSKELPKGVSGTSIKVIEQKAMLSKIGRLPRDKAAEMLFKQVDKNASWSYTLFLYKSVQIVEWLLRRNLLLPRFGEEMTYRDNLALRVTMIKRLVQQELRKGCSQLVLFGAGFDAIAYGNDVVYAAERHGLKAFEIDKADTQALKMKYVKMAGISCVHVEYIAAELGKDNGWVDQLLSAGFEPSQKTLFIFEGLSYYLTKENVQQTFVEAFKISDTGSKLVFDFPFLQRVPIAAKEALKKINEPWLFDLRSEQPTESSCTIAITQFVNETGWQLTQVNFLSNAEFGFGPYVGGCATISKL